MAVQYRTWVDPVMNLLPVAAACVAGLTKTPSCGPVTGLHWVQMCTVDASTIECPHQPASGCWSSLSVPCVCLPSSLLWWSLKHKMFISFFPLTCCWHRWLTDSFSVILNLLHWKVSLFNSHGLVWCWSMPFRFGHLLLLLWIPVPHLSSSS